MTDPNDDWLFDDEPVEVPTTGAVLPGEHSSHLSRLPFPLQERLTALLAQPIEPKDTLHIRRLRKAFPRAFAPWFPYEDDLIRDLLREGVLQEDLSLLLQRQPGGIEVRVLLLTQGPEAVQALNDAKRREKAVRKEARVARRQERVSTQAQHKEIDVQLAMVAPHLEAWYALMQGGTSIRVLDGVTPVFTMTPIPQNTRS